MPSPLRSALPRAATLLFALLASGLGTLFAAEPATLQTATLRLPEPPAATGNFKMGTARRPDGRELTVDSRSLRLDGQAWLPVMGEFHYSRYPAEEWREELLKMKAGGVDIVATYVFWIHHEEVEGTWDWSGQRDLHRFVETARDAGLSVIVRCGPWCHGEVRNGGFPEWAVLRHDWKTRSTDPKFLEAVRALYGQIATQLRGQLWKDGGPVVGIQLDNEFRGPAEYLLALKTIARDAGLDVPLYTRTGWPALTTPMPPGEILPLHGVYAEGFWDREITPMPGRYWAGFHFATLRTDANIANELLGRRDAKDTADVARYPYLTCEIGGGMMSSYHRRILVDPRDVESTTLVKIAGGSTLPGYYMYHGGMNPDGKLTTLMEAQDTLATNYNDLPVKNYDFQAPLGAFGQIRAHYHTQRRLHLFLRDFGPVLAGMTTALPDVRPSGKDDLTTLRWAARSDGQAGFVFVNNYERLKTLPGKPGVQFSLKLADGTALTFPDAPVTVPADAIFFWPFNFDLGRGVNLTWATAQPICAIDDGDMRTVFFAETAGVPPQFSLGGAVQTVKPSRNAGIVVPGPKGGHVRIVVLSVADSLALWKGTWQGRDRVFLTHAGLVLDGDALRLTSEEPHRLQVLIVPAPASVFSETSARTGKPEGVFIRFQPRVPDPYPSRAGLSLLRSAGPPREIKNGPIKQGVPQAPTDADFAQAAEWRISITLRSKLALARNPILRFHYAGDVARVTLDGKLIADDFFNGGVFDLGLRRFAPDILKGDLRLAVLPLRENPPLYFSSAVGGKSADAGANLLPRIEIVESTTVSLTATP